MDDKLTFHKIIDFEESQNLYKMNVHKDARKYSFNKKKFSLNDHIKWMEQKIKSKKDRLYVYKLNKKTIGYIGEKEKYKKKYLSWSLMPNLRFNGYGTKMLKKFLNINNETYYAFVHKDNTASKKMSLKIGFKVLQQRKNFYLLKFSKKKH